MRKPKYEFGNVGPNYMGEKKDRKRCHECDYFNGTNGPPRVMRKHPHVAFAYLCEKCFKSEGEMKDFHNEDWYREAVEVSRQSVDNEHSYDEMVEDLISEWEKTEGR